MKRRCVAVLVFAAAVLCPPLGASARSTTTRPAEAKRQAEAKPTPAEAAARARKIAGLNREALRQFKAGRYDRCKALLDGILRIDPGSSLAHYNLACLHSRRKRPAEAFSELNAALDSGYTGFRHLERDPDLDPLRKLPPYKKVLARKAEVQRGRAAKILATLKARFGEGFICEIDHDSKLVFATDTDRRTLGELKASLSQYAAAQWKTMFDNTFEEYVTIVIPRDAKSLPAGFSGIYDPQLKQLTARSIGMVLTHEFTHALHFADQNARGQHHPIWIAEGLATLFESSTIVASAVSPVPNRRANAIKYLVGRKRNIPWKDFVKLSHGQYMAKAATAYPQGRYMLMYLYEKGLLKKWYNAYTASYGKDRTGAKAIEKVFAKPLTDVEADWLAWVVNVKSVPRRLAPKQAYIGVQLARQFDGLRILHVVGGSAAARAGLKVGDVLKKVDGRRMVDMAELLRTVSSHKVGDRVRIEFRRGTKYMTVTATLGAVPTRLLPAPKPKPKPKPKSKPEKKKAA